MLQPMLMSAVSLCYYPVQVKLYEDFAKSQASKKGDKRLDDDSCVSQGTTRQDEKTKDTSQTHVFQVFCMLSCMLVIKSYVLSLDRRKERTVHNTLGAL